MKVGRESSRAEVRAGTQLGGQRSRMRPRAPRHGDGGGGPGPSCGERGSGAWFSLSAKESHWRLWGRDMMCADLHSRGHFAGGEHLMGAGGSRCGSPGQTG